MPAEQPRMVEATLPALVEAGDWFLNLAFMVSAQKTGSPDPESEVRLTMTKGDQATFSGAEAALIIARLRALAPVPREPAVVATPTKVRGRRITPR